MCVFGKDLKNPRYTENKKNGGKIPPFPVDKKGNIIWSVNKIQTKCGTCIECRRERANEWRIRLYEEAKANNWKGKFVTLTFSEEHMTKLKEEVGDDADEIAKVALRRYMELWRKKHKTRPRHWFINELGHKNTERLHLHGIIFTDKSDEEILKHWRYGKEKYCGYSFGEKVIGYITKYITKDDPMHKGWKGRVLCSPGIGKEWLTNEIREQHKFRGKDTQTRYRERNGRLKSMPMYYKRKLWNDEERETLRTINEERKEITIGGIKLSNRGTRKDNIRIIKAQAQRRAKLNMLGMGERRRRHYTATRGREIIPPTKTELRDKMRAHIGTKADLWAFEGAQSAEPDTRAKIIEWEMERLREYVKYRGLHGWSDDPWDA